jgi:hypothetical protein
MAATTSVPLTIEPEAAARIAELGMKAELEHMLDHTRKVVPHLRHIGVTLTPPYDTGDEPYLAIEATRSGTYAGDDPTEREWGNWLINTFPADVWRHFSFFVIYGTADAG